MPKKPLGATFAAQVSEMVADAVMSKLTAISLTAENMKKLEGLGEAPRLLAIGGGSQAASLIDSVLNKLTSTGLTKENIKNLVILGEGKPSLIPGEASQAAGTPLHPDNNMDNPEILSLSFTEDPFDPSTWATKSKQQGLLSRSQTSTGWPQPLVDKGLPLSERQPSTMPSHPPKKLCPFETVPELYGSLMQFLGNEGGPICPNISPRRR